ncbi:hypothetical protein ELQ90_03580 [Labedella phragmitis]|uniref:Uncharacterized protein n=1 Tax=Labedella phragmitis TaxID=2498849 RepID=A0A444PYZ6_9MICO|nr:hypothetical protein [Labedella phragmitis]RWZ53021.1 hypothetical protein ELQ90_03580 [Labedella phragmitis]
MDKDERARRAAEQEERARAAIEAIMSGGDLGRETQALSNEFSDRQWARLTAAIRRILRRPDATDGPTTNV